MRAEEDEIVCLSECRCKCLQGENWRMPTLGHNPMFPCSRGDTKVWLAACSHRSKPALFLTVQKAQSPCILFVTSRTRTFSALRKPLGKAPTPFSWLLECRHRTHQKRAMHSFALKNALDCSDDVVHCDRIEWRIECLCL